MANIKLGSPYKVIQRKQKQYVRHYEIPASECIVVPSKIYGDQILCDVTWLTDLGVQHKNLLMFSASNLEAIDAIRDYHLQVVWEEMLRTELRSVASLHD